MSYKHEASTRKGFVLPTAFTINVFGKVKYKINYTLDSPRKTIRAINLNKRWTDERESLDRSNPLFTLK